MKKKTKVNKVKHTKRPNTIKLKKQDEELDEMKKIEKNLPQEEKFLKKILKRFKKL